MAHSITAKHFFEWQAYMQLEPFGEDREDYRAASIVQAVHETMRVMMMLWTKKGAEVPKSLTLEDARVKFGERDPEEKKQEIAQHEWQIMIAKAMVAAQNEIEESRQKVLKP